MLIGRDVLIPAVIPCGDCDLCRAGHDNACLHQVMPGNHAHGGFATEIVVPGRHLVSLDPDRGGYELADLAVVADAVTTPYQAMTRAEVQRGDLVIVIGVGGIGTYAVQIARSLGALGGGGRRGPVETRAPRRRSAPSGYSTRESLTHRQSRNGSWPARATQWKILEMSGTLPGQELAWRLLVPAATLGIIGFTMDKAQVRLSNLMALDATRVRQLGMQPAPVCRCAEPGAVRTRHAPAVHRAPADRRRPGTVRSNGRCARRQRSSRDSRAESGGPVTLKDHRLVADPRFEHIRYERRPAARSARARRPRALQRLDLAEQPGAAEQLHDRRVRS